MNEPNVTSGDDDISRPELVLAQAVLSNWAIEELAGGPSGYAIGLATRSSLSDRNLAELMDWLQFKPRDESTSKRVFAALSDGRVFWAKLSALPFVDDLGRTGKRYWGHALVCESLPDDLRAQSPVSRSWWGSLPWFATLDEAKAAATTGTLNLEAERWTVPPLEDPCDGPYVLEALTTAMQATTRGTSSRQVLWELDEGDDRWGAVPEPFRILPTTEWRNLAVDTGFDGLVPSSTRRYWVVGRERHDSLPSRTGDAVRVIRQDGESPYMRWVIDRVTNRHWASVVRYGPSVKDAMEALLAGPVLCPEGYAAAEDLMMPGYELRGGTVGQGEREAVANFLKSYGREELFDATSRALRECRWPPELVEILLSRISNANVSDLIQWYRTVVLAETAGVKSAQPVEWRQQLDLAVLPIFFDVRSVDRIRALADAIRSWPDAGRHPLLRTWSLVQLHENSGSRLRFGRRAAVSVPSGIPYSLSQLPLELQQKWTTMVVRHWPDCPLKLVVPLPEKLNDVWRRQTELVLAVLISMTRDPDQLQAWASELDAWLGAPARPLCAQLAAAAERLLAQRKKHFGTRGRK